MPLPTQYSSARRLAVMLLLALSLGGCADKDGEDHETAAPDPDGRTTIVLPAPGRHMVLTEMRVMLTSVQGFVAAAAISDTAAMRAAASASGMTAARDMDPAVEQRLPPEFVQLGMATHAAWDSLAMDVSAGVPTDRALNRLGAVMSNCVSCHAQFRIEVGKGEKAED